MKNNDNAIVSQRETVSPGRLRSDSQHRGLAWGALGVLAFSFTLPATKLAVASMDSAVVGLGRALVASVCGATLLALTRQRWPTARQWARLSLVTLGVVTGFPLLTALALRDVPSSHGAIVVGLLPAATATMAVVRAGERPGAGFWLASALGVAAITVFAAIDGLGQIHRADALLLGAVLLAALGYAEGGALARELGAWQVICWALLAGAPICLAILIATTGTTLATPTATSLLGFAYVSLVSMFLGFFAWYRGLAICGVARVGQLQLLQPILTLSWGRLLLGEALTDLHLLAAAAVCGCVALSLRLRVSRTI